MKVIAKNKRALHDFDIAETIVAGLVLKGSEVKSIKHGHVSLKGSYVRFHDGEPVLTNMHVSAYRPAAHNQHELTRDRKLLLHKQQIQRLRAARQNNRHIVPIKIGIQRGLVKLELGIGASRKKYDKRELLKRRDAQRDIERSLKRGR